MNKHLPAEINPASRVKSFEEFFHGIGALIEASGIKPAMLKPARDLYYAAKDRSVQLKIAVIDAPFLEETYIAFGRMTKRNI